MYFIHVYMYIYFQKKKFKISKSFPKKEKNFQKKKKIFGLGELSPYVMGIELPSDFFKKAHFFFLSKISRFFKVFFSKW